MYFFVGVFYFTLANFHPALRSKLNSIYLFGVIKNPILTEYGFNKVLQSFVDDMKQLVSYTFELRHAFYYNFLSRPMGLFSQ